MSTPSNPLQSIIHTAIQREIDAHTLYINAAKIASTPHARDLLLDMAAQELGHRNRLEAMLKGDTFKILTKKQQKQVVDLKITDYLIEEPLSPDSDLQTILIVAGKREKGSFELYSAMARVASDPDTVRLFEFLANEELTHKRRVETMYDELVYQEN
ncbi:MAG: ferritin-like domain-containing protein [Anaerolineae bacterium]